MKGRTYQRLFFFIFVAAALLLRARASAQPALLPIGAIQGAGDVSPFLNRFVNFRGVVVGRYEDENTRGDVYYTLFVQDIPGQDDGDPATSDGVAVFLGRTPRPDVPLGAQVLVGGKVTEFYGLTEIDDDGLVVTIEALEGPVVEPALIDPPPDMAEQAVYFEALESMRVAYAGAVVVAGPTHEGCGFAVIAEAAVGDLPAIRRAAEAPVGRVVPVLYPSDKACDDIPQVKTGDKLSGMEGALVYNFDQFEIVFDTTDSFAVEPAPLMPLPALPATGPEQIVLASINLEDFFDTARDTDEEGEPVLTPEELVARQAKLVHFITTMLDCPTLVGVQEVEHVALLGELSASLAAPCGFAYAVSHLDSPDARGIDNALLSDPRRVDIGAVALRQVCSPVPTEVSDPSAACEAGQEPLFGRPPLQVDARIDGEPYTLFVNHFKSKRGGEIETDLERIRQAVVLNGLAAELLAAEPAVRVIALGDFNDADLSPALALLTDPVQGGVFANALAAVHEGERYSYNFGGVSELIDMVLVSRALAGEIGWATIVHANTDFPSGWRLDTSPERLIYRTTDHDVPVVAFGQWAPTPEPEPTAEATPVAQAPTPEATDDGRPLTVDAPVIEVVLTETVTAVPSLVVEPVATPSAVSTTIETSPAQWLFVLLGAFVTFLLIWLLVRKMR